MQTEMNYAVILLAVGVAFLIGYILIETETNYPLLAMIVTILSVAGSWILIERAKLKQK